MKSRFSRTQRLVVLLATLACALLIHCDGDETNSTNTAGTAGTSGTSQAGSAGFSGVSGQSGTSGTTSQSGAAGNSGSANAGASGIGGSAGSTEQWQPITTIDGCDVEQFVDPSQLTLNWESCGIDSLPGCEKGDFQLGVIPFDAKLFANGANVVDDGQHVLFAATMLAQLQGMHYFVVASDQNVVQLFRNRIHQDDFCMMRFSGLTDGLAVVELFKDSTVPSGLISVDIAAKSAFVGTIDFSPAFDSPTAQALNPTRWAFASPFAFILGTVSPLTGGQALKIASSNPDGPTIKWGFPSAGPDFFFVNQVYLEDGVPYRQRIAKTDGLTEPVPFLSPTEPGTDLGAAMFANSHIVWMKGKNLIDPGAFTYEQAELWSAPYTTDPAQIQGELLDTAPFNALISHYSRAAWGHLAAPHIATGELLVWNLNTKEKKTISLPADGNPPMYLHDILGLSHNQVYFSSEETCCDNAGKMLHRMPVP